MKIKNTLKTVTICLILFSSTSWAQKKPSADCGTVVIKQIVGTGGITKQIVGTGGIPKQIVGTGGVKYVEIVCTKGIVGTGG